MLQALSAVALSNIYLMEVTLPVSKATVWSKSVHDRSIDSIFVTLLVSKVSGWSKAMAPQNMYFSVVTLLVSKASG